MPHILWRGINRTSLERCVLESVANGHRLSATTLAVVDGVAVEIRTSVITDAEWNPTTVGVHAQGAGDDRTLALTGDGAGSWSVGDAPLVDLYGAVDVHLGWSPAGHTLTLRRLDLDIGESATVTALWIGFPERDVVREVHAYERPGPSPLPLLQR